MPSSSAFCLTLTRTKPSKCKKRSAPARSKAPKCWYESGPVNDVLIENNSFIECAFNGGPAGAVIALNPSNRIVDANRPVHRNVRIIGNRFRTFGNPLLFAKSTQGLTFRDNTVTYSPEVKNQPKLFLLNGYKDVSIEKNQFPTPLAKEQTQTSNMP